jgi:hypothetical protein
MNLTFFFKTAYKWITSETSSATTYRVVVNHLTPSIETTGSGTWIRAFLIYTGFILRTVSTDNAFRSTRWWSSNIVWLTRTNSMIIHWATNTVRTTR